MHLHLSLNGLQHMAGLHMLHHSGPSKLVQHQQPGPGYYPKCDLQLTAGMQCIACQQAWWQSCSPRKDFWVDLLFQGRVDSKTFLQGVVGSGVDASGSKSAV